MIALRHNAIISWFIRRISERALAIGLVHRTAPDAVAAALELAERLAEAAPIAVSAALESIEGGRDLPLADALSHEHRCYERVLASADRREALEAFLEKRRPTFRGR